MIRLLLGEKVVEMMSLVRMIGMMFKRFCFRSSLILIRLSLKSLMRGKGWWLRVLELVSMVRLFLRVF